MNGTQWIACCAAMGTVVFVVPANVPAQDPFTERAASKHQAATAEEGRPEKPGLAADRTTEEAAEASDFCRCIGGTVSRSVAKIERALRNPLRSTGLELVDTPLEKVVALLQEDYGIPIQLDTNALDEIGLGPEEPVTINLHNISLRSALHLILKQLGLTYVIQNEVLMITTPDEAESQLTTCVYDVRGLTDDAADKAGKALVDAITSCVATETWAVHGGGEAEIRALKPGFLVVSQTQAVHEEIRRLLSAIRQMRHEPTPARGGEGFFQPDPARND